MKADAATRAAARQQLAQRDSLLEAAKLLAQAFERLDEEGFINSYNHEGDERCDLLRGLAWEAIFRIKAAWRDN